MIKASKLMEYTLAVIVAIITIYLICDIVQYVRSGECRENAERNGYGHYVERREVSK